MEPFTARLRSTKIGIIGPQNVGKTALASLLVGHLKTLGVSCDLVAEISRSSPLPLHDQTSVESSYWLFGSQVAAEVTVQAVRDVAICDRTVLDLHPFAQHVLLADTLDADTRQHNIQALSGLRQLITDYISARPYRFLFYVPVRRELWSTPQSPDALAYQHAIDRTFRAFLHELALQFHELRALTTYDRLHEVLQHIESAD